MKTYEIKFDIELMSLTRDLPTLLQFIILNKEKIFDIKSQPFILQRQTIQPSQFPING